MFRRVVLPLDGSVTAERALPHAVSAAQAMDARLVLLRVIDHQAGSDTNRPADPLEWELLKAEAGAYLNAVAARLAQLGVETETATAEGDAVEEIVNCARAGPRTLLVICSHGSSGTSAWVLGGVVQKTALHANVSFLVVRAYSTEQPDAGSLVYRRVLLPLDGSRRAECVLPMLETLTRRHGSEVVLVSVVNALATCAGLADDDSRLGVLRELDAERVAGAGRYLQSLAQRLAGEGMSTRTRVELQASSDVALREIAAEEQVDLVILAAHGGACGARLPFGAVPMNLLIYGETPLLVIQDLPPEEIELSRAARSAREVSGH
ncbi:nucleotide-binding universal stress UspA family protein [Natronocella acetinitrilica]|uniref:Nucleotide-binding universal stress UspA family protein n=1 Tax=Natronocella acetinitrilica TaxID=414046 RepID=A0AAE3KDK1_9GAMM|nr:universal stress protein [Natronocella acetinitrilica]MCP1676939.1 nucleotide-binding universal stress UspA family protein [Natronocella acetinitrilica]